MDALSNWDDLFSLRRSDAASTLPQEEDFAQYFVDKNFDNLFNETLHTLQDLDVPPGYDQAGVPAQLLIMPLRHMRQQLSHASPYRHCKKPSGTAIFGFLDHNRELSLSGSNADIFRLMKPAENCKSISPTQLSRGNQNQMGRLGPPVLISQSRTPHPSEKEKKESDDIIVTTNNPKSYKFPALPSPPPEEDCLNAALPLQTIQHPLVGDETYPDEIDDILDIPPEAKRYVPIPVQYPSSHSLNELPLHVQQPATARQRSKVYSPSKSAEQTTALYDDRFLISELEPFVVPDDFLGGHSNPNYNRSDRILPVRGGAGLLNMNMNVFMPPPICSLLSHDSPEPHSPLPQAYSSPIHQTRGQLTALSPSVKHTFYNPQFFSDDAGNYYEPQPSLLDLSPPRPSSIQSSPIRRVKQMTETAIADETVTDVNETILQLTPLRAQAPMTPSRKRITLEWSPIISPDGKDTGEVKKAIQELSPKRMVKKTSLLPPGELDRHWEGPDASKIFTCTYENCGKKFTRRYNVRSHIQTHLSDRPFTCTYCPKNFVRQHDLNRHVKSHMVSKYCRCRCGKEFTRVEGYKKHLANGVCSKGYDNRGVSKPITHRLKGETVLDGLTSNRLNEELGLLQAP